MIVIICGIVVLVVLILFVKNIKVVLKQKSKNEIVEKSFIINVVILGTNLILIIIFLIWIIYGLSKLMNNIM